MASKPKPQSLSSQNDNRAPRTRLTQTQGWIAATIALGISALVFFSNTGTGSYTVCSKAKNIYTVDPHNPRVQCITVRGTEIAEVGNYGEFLRVRHMDLRVSVRNGLLNHRVLNNIAVAGSASWSQPYFVEAMGLLPSWITKYTRLGGRVIQLDDSSVLVPGLAGASLCY